MGRSRKKGIWKRRKKSLKSFIILIKYELKLIVIQANICCYKKTAFKMKVVNVIDCRLVEN